MPFGFCLYVYSPKGFHGQKSLGNTAVHSTSICIYIIVNGVPQHISAPSKIHGCCGGVYSKWGPHNWDTM